MRNEMRYPQQREVDVKREPLLVQLGQRITELRLARKWARSHLARRLEVPRTRVASWERGVHQPPLAMLLAMGRIFGISIEELAGSADSSTTLPEP